MFVWFILSDYLRVSSSYSCMPFFTAGYSVGCVCKLYKQFLELFIFQDCGEQPFKGFYTVFVGFADTVSGRILKGHELLYVSGLNFVQGRRT